MASGVGHITLAPIKIEASSSVGVSGVAHITLPLIEIEAVSVGELSPDDAKTLLALWLLDLLADARRDWPARKQWLKQNWRWIHTALIIIAAKSCGGGD